MDPEDMMPCGDCPVCDEMVDHREAGFCADCGNAFHWTRCGTWWDGEHRCENCQKEDDEEPTDCPAHYAGIIGDAT